MRARKICVLGGTGFVGSHVVSRLVKAGHQLRVLTRYRERHRDLLVLPTAEVFAADIHNLGDLEKYFAHQDAVINLVGILNEKGDKGRGFRHVHVTLVQKVIEACRRQDVKRLLHMSALNADAAQGPSYYLRTKGEAEGLVHATAGINVTSFRPSVIFGWGDSFFNRFAHLLKLTPFVFPLACGKARFAPVYVDDVAHAFTSSLDDPHTYGMRYDLCGPNTYTLEELVRYTARLIGVRRYILCLGRKLSRMQANIFEHVPGKPFSRDNFRSLQVDCVCKEGFPKIFGIEPHSVEAEVPKYLSLNTQRQRYAGFRRHAHRN